MAFVLVFNVKVETLLHKGEILAFSTVWCPAESNIFSIFLFLIISEIYNFVVHLILNCIVMLDILILTFDYFLTKILLHSSETLMINIKILVKISFIVAYLINSEQKMNKLFQHILRNPATRDKLYKLTRYIEPQEMTVVLVIIPYHPQQNKTFIA